jgi:hypothetical protein
MKGLSPWGYAVYTIFMYVRDMLCIPSLLLVEQRILVFAQYIHINMKKHNELPVLCFYIYLIHWHIASSFGVHICISDQIIHYSHIC